MTTFLPVYYRRMDGNDMFIYPQCSLNILYDIEFLSYDLELRKEKEVYIQEPGKSISPNILMAMWLMVAHAIV